MKANLISNEVRNIKKFNNSYNVGIYEYTTFIEVHIQNRNYPHSSWYGKKFRKSKVQNMEYIDKLIDETFIGYYNSDFSLYSEQKAFRKEEARKEAKVNVMLETTALIEEEQIEEIAAACNVLTKKSAEAYAAARKAEIAQRVLSKAECALYAAKKAFEEAEKALKEAEKEYEELDMVHKVAAENYNEVKALHIFLKEAEEKECNIEVLHEKVNECKKEKAKARAKEEEAAELFNIEMQDFNECLYELEFAEKAKNYAERAAVAVSKELYFDRKVAYYEERIDRIQILINNKLNEESKEEVA